MVVAKVECLDVDLQRKRVDDDSNMELGNQWTHKNTFWYVVIKHNPSYTTRKHGPNPLCTSTQLRLSEKKLIQTTNPWLFGGPFSLECVHSGFVVETSGFQWMGVVHCGIIVDTLPYILDHS